MKDLHPLQEAVANFLQKHPGAERFLADNLKVSIPTLKRWKVGKNLPQPFITKAVLKHLKRLRVPPHPKG